MRALFIAVRLAGAAAILAAVLTQLINNFAYWGANDVGPASALVTNFLSYFTIDSNILSVVSFLVGVVLLIRRKDDSPNWAVFRASVTAYMTVTFIVYNTLLRSVNVADGLVVPWTNEVLHVIGPLLVIADWLFAPGRRRIEWKAIWTIIIFPLVWAVYTMIRGPFAYNHLVDQPTWYPYPFLNPANSPEGYISVAFYVVLIAAIIGGVGALVIWVTRRPSARWPLPAAK
jgi:hypothetical protein